MNYEVYLRLHDDDDDSTGAWGLTHHNTMGKFNTFWSADGIFHDVFEHYFEDDHKYFRGDAAFTLFGEAAASGHALAYSELGIDNFRHRQNGGRSRDFQADTRTFVEQYVYEIQGGTPRDEALLEFPASKLECRIPYQRNISAYNLESTLSDYMEYLKDNKPCLRDVVWAPGFLRAYRWGYKRAQRIIGKDTKTAYVLLDQFLERWNNITSNNDADNIFIEHEDAEIISGFKFKISHKNGILRIKETIVDGLFREYPMDLLSN